MSFFQPGHSHLHFITMTTSTETDHAHCIKHINTAQISSELPQHPLVFIVLTLFATLPTLSMNTRQKNKTAHPGIPDMTPSQLALAGLPCTTNAHHTNTSHTSNKKPMKNQQITALKDELRAAQELILNVTSLSLVFGSFYLYPSTFQNGSSKHMVHNDRVQASLDVGGDTDPATDTEDDRTVVTGTKRKGGKSTSSATRCALSYAIHIIFLS